MKEVVLLCVYCVHAGLSLLGACLKIKLCVHSQSMPHMLLYWLLFVCTCVCMCSHAPALDDVVNYGVQRLQAVSPCLIKSD